MIAFDCEFRDATANGNGGAIAVVGAHARIAGSFFVGCAAATSVGASIGSGGAIWASSATTSTTWSSTSLPSSLHISTCKFRNNQAGLGGAVTLAAMSVGSIQNVHFTDPEQLTDVWLVEDPGGQAWQPPPATLCWKPRLHKH